MPQRYARLLPLTGGLLLFAACQGRPDASVSADANASRVPGQISVTFRNRWWHFYERGLSWADGGQDAQAEADFRQCLRLRETDSRLARTYGMHFVQCFAHRELGAVLLRRGAMDEAERELRLSRDQEPSAKTDWLLERLAEARQAPAAAVPAPIIPVASLPPGGRGIEVSRIAQGAQSLLRIDGRLLGDIQAALWSTAPGGETTRLTIQSNGGFQAELPPGSMLSLGTSTGPDRESAPLAVAAPSTSASLSLDGPDQGSVVADGHAWYRWQATAATGLIRLEVDDDQGSPLARLPLHGQSSAGTLRLDLASGEQVLHFRVVDAQGASTKAERRVEARPSAQQDRRLRAVALAIPVQSARPGGLRPGDDPRLRSALLEDGRFRFVDTQADELLTRKLALVEAGYVDRSTAAAAGQRLNCRYVIAGTLTRGERDAECFLRLIHCDSGRVVASADAYAEIAASTDADRLYAATAGRLRQVFPVVSGTITPSGDGQARLDCGSRSGAVALMRVHVFPQAGVNTGKPDGHVEIQQVDVGSAQARIVDGRLPAQAWGVSE